MAPSNSKTVTKAPAAKKSTESEEPKEIIRDEIFSRFDRPLGLMDQHIFNIITLAASHIFAVYTILFVPIPWKAFVFFALPYGYLGGIGITVGAHRYWTHKTFKANLPLQIIMMCFQTIAFQWPIHKWCLDHRIHHKYTDTDADPHNSTRGFWYSHILWLLQPKTKELKEKLKTFDMSDLEKDPVVRFQSRFYYELLLVFHLLLPMYVLNAIWGLAWFDCFCVCLLRHAISLNITWMVNSVAHIWGDKPFDINLSAVDNPAVSFFAVGEGWHNYHHTFPWDYKAAELGWKFNLSTIFIDFFAAIGWAWDMKVVSPKMLKDRMERTGDGSRLAFRVKDTKGKDKQDPKNLYDTTMCWGWDDESIPSDLRKLTTVYKPEGK